jgi:hypothetical protein
MTTTVLAQNGNRLGIRAGFQTAQLESDIGGLFDNNHNRYYIGLYKESSLIPLLKFSAGVEYYETGSRQGVSDLKLGYISSPLALKADIGLFNVYGGISGAYRLYAQERLNGEEVDIPDNKYSRFDYSTFVGGGITILFVGIDIRHHWGKTDVYDGFQNRFWQMGATLKF